MNWTRREFALGAGAALCGTGVRGLLAIDSKDAIKAALARRDRAVLVHDHWVRDPYIALGKDGWYYYTGTMQGPSIVEDEETRNNVGLGTSTMVSSMVRVYRSRDLVEWEGGGPVASLENTAYYEKFRAKYDSTPANRRNIWAPELHQREDGRWAIIFTVPQPLAPDFGAGLLLSAGSELKGPWTNPLADVGHRHDPSLFRDDDGTWWVIYTCTKIQPLNKDWSGWAGPAVELSPALPSTHMGHEGCLILKVKEKYVLFGTGWSTGHRHRYGSYNLYYATADKVTGPYGPRRLAGRFLGHGTPFIDKNGKWWCTAFFNANISPLPAEGIEKRDLHETAQTINDHGLTLVPMDIRKEGDDVVVRALDPHYATPGPDEAPFWTDDNVAG
jgi:xylan 1,4-beta-xylosidase